MFVHVIVAVLHTNTLRGVSLVMMGRTLLFGGRHESRRESPESWEEVAEVEIEEMRVEAVL